MAIIVNGRKYRRLEEPLYVNGKKVMKAFANEKMVYPEIPPYVIKLRGFSTGPKGEGAFNIGGATIEVVCVITSYGQLTFKWREERPKVTNIYNDGDVPTGYVPLHPLYPSSHLGVDLPVERWGIYLHADKRNYRGSQYYSPFNPSGYYYRQYGDAMYKAFTSTVNNIALIDNTRVERERIDRDKSLYRGVPGGANFTVDEDDPIYGAIVGFYGFHYCFNFTDDIWDILRGERFANPLTEVLYTNCQPGKFTKPTEPTPESALKITKADFKTIKGA